MPISLERSLVKLLLLFLLTASTAFAQSGPSASYVPEACGPTQIQFSVKTDNSQHSVSNPEPGKALVYVIEEFQNTSRGILRPTVRVGLDGVWVGANRGASYLFFSVAPGEHHLCASWQSSDREIATQYSLTNFTAETGKVYFFKVEPREESLGNDGNAWSKDLAPVNPDEGQYLIAVYPRSVSQPKK